MVITLYEQELYNDFRSKSHYEVAEITDAEARYRAEAGTEKQGEIVRCIRDGIAQARHRCLRFLDETITPEADDSYATDDVEYVFSFPVSERRAIGKAEPLAAALHNFVVHYAMSKFYSSVSQMELSNKHSLQAVENGTDIDRLLYTKQPPRV